MNAVGNTSMKEIRRFFEVLRLFTHNVFKFIFIAPKTYRTLLLFEEL